MAILKPLMIKLATQTSKDVRVCKSKGNPGNVLVNQVNSMGASAVIIAMSRFSIGCM
jgi:hypothetical protein